MLIFIRKAADTLANCNNKLTKQEWPRHQSTNSVTELHTSTKTTTLQFKSFNNKTSRRFVTQLKI